MKNTIALSALLLTTIFAAQAQPRSYCAAKPPPEGLVDRCHVMNMVVPETRAAFNYSLFNWMRTCVIAERAVTLVSDADENIGYVWKLVQDLPAHRRSVSIYPEYEPLSFTQDGRTCYGVKSVRFRTSKRGASVDYSADPIVTAVPPAKTVTSDMVKDAARVAIKAIEKSSRQTNQGLARFHGVLEGIAKHGHDFDATYYPVAPTLVTGNLDVYSCDRAFKGGQQQCLPRDEAIKACTRNLADDLVTAYHFDGLKGQPLTELLEIKSNEIYRGFQYVYLEQQLDSTISGLCPSLIHGIKPRMGELAKRGMTTVYGYY